MKKTISLLTLISASAGATPVSTYLKTRLPSGSWKGLDGTDACKVMVKHDGEVSEGKYATFEVMIVSADEQTKTSYRLNDTFSSGGRGDCPNLLVDSRFELFVMNFPANFPCLASYGQTNHGGLRVKFRNDSTIIVSIYNENKKLLRQCKVGSMDIGTDS